MELKEKMVASLRNSQKENSSIAISLSSPRGTLFDEEGNNPMDTNPNTVAPPPLDNPQGQNTNISELQFDEIIKLNSLVAFELSPNCGIQLNQSLLLNVIQTLAKQITQANIQIQEMNQKLSRTANENENILYSLGMNEMRTKECMNEMKQQKQMLSTNVAKVVDSITQMNELKAEIKHFQKNLSSGGHHHSYSPPPAILPTVPDKNLVPSYLVKEVEQVVNQNLENTLISQPPVDEVEKKKKKKKSSSTSKQRHEDKDSLDKKTSPDTKIQQEMENETVSFSPLPDIHPASDTATHAHHSVPTRTNNVPTISSLGSLFSLEETEMLRQLVPHCSKIISDIQIRDSNEYVLDSLVTEFASGLTECKDNISFLQADKVDQKSWNELNLQNANLKSSFQEMSLRYHDSETRIRQLSRVVFGFDDARKAITDLSNSLRTEASETKLWVESQLKILMKAQIDQNNCIKHFDENHQNSIKNLQQVQQDLSHTIKKEVATLQQSLASKQHLTVVEKQLAQVQSFLLETSQLKSLGTKKNYCLTCNTPTTFDTGVETLRTSNQKKEGLLNMMSKARRLAVQDSVVIVSNDVTIDNCMPVVLPTSSLSPNHKQIYQPLHLPNGAPSQVLNNASSHSNTTLVPLPLNSVSPSLQGGVSPHSLSITHNTPNGVSSHSQNEGVLSKLHTQKKSNRHSKIVRNSSVDNRQANSAAAPTLLNTSSLLSANDQIANEFNQITMEKEEMINEYPPNLSKEANNEIKSASGISAEYSSRIPIPLSLSQKNSRSGRKEGGARVVERYGEENSLNSSVAGSQDIILTPRLNDFSKKSNLSEHELSNGPQSVPLLSSSHIRSSLGSEKAVEERNSNLMSSSMST